jgi:hypothetical protein
VVGVVYEYAPVTLFIVKLLDTGNAVAPTGATHKGSKLPFEYVIVPVPPDGTISVEAVPVTGVPTGFVTDDGCVMANGPTHVVAVTVTGVVGP